MNVANANFLKQESLENIDFKSKVKAMMSGLSGAFTFPISTLAILSIFLSLGGFLESLGESNKGLQIIGFFIKSLTYPILQALPLLFCVAFAASFCKNDITYIWGSIVAYLVFLATQNVFICPNPRESGTFTHNSGTWSIDNFKVDSYVILFPGAGRDGRDGNNSLNLVDRTLGFTSLNTSIFGALVVGGVLMPYIQKHWGNVQLPGPLSFFSGKRFVPLAAAIGGMWAATMFLLFWPWIGYVFNLFGHYVNGKTYGADSFIFGFLERSLIPFGLHHAFYSPLWFTSIGGNAVMNINNLAKCGNGELLHISESGTGSGTGSGTTTSCNHHSNGSNIHGKDSYQRFYMPSSAAGVLWNLFKGARNSHAMWAGDAFLGLSAISLPTNEIKFDPSVSTFPVMTFFEKKLGINIGRFTQGKYPIMQFGLPFAGIAMLYAAPKDKRKEAEKVIIPGILSSLLMGITEPLEFTFLFCAPKLFYGFHAVMCGLSFGLMNYLGAHMPSIFSGGLIEAILLGIIPKAKGTNFHVYWALGGLFAPLYFTVFSIAIRYWNLKTPGRDDSIQMDSNISTTSNSKVPEATRKLALALGGWENLEKMGNCASRLRYDIVDKSKVNEAALKAAGAIAVKWIGDNHAQIIMGPKAESINNEMNKWKGEAL